MIFFFIAIHMKKIHFYLIKHVFDLKGKFSSGREGALASTFNYDFK